ncbi:Sensor histidine kinase [hydrothermal vent metagenome]|uniref:Sensor histidine kinase n=1 Tax=hydrothermal vent metagenome TaxID=652676 RepID=A0A160TH51_9ZZZZ
MQDRYGVDANPESDSAGSAAPGVSGRHRTIAELRESEEQFRMLAENLPGLCWVGDENGVLRWANRQWHEMFGGTSAEQGDPSGICHPDDLPLALETWKRSWDEGETSTLLLRMRCPDGSYRPYLSKAVPIRDADGTVVRWCGVQIDFSDKQAHDRRQAVLRTFHDQSRDLADAEAILIMLSRVLAEHLGVAHMLYGEIGDIGADRPDIFHAAGGVRQHDTARLLALGEALAGLAGRHDVNESRVVEDNHGPGRDPADPVRRVAELIGVRSSINVPIVKEGTPVAMLAVLDTLPRIWTRDEIELCEELAERVWATLARARAEAALQERERNQAFLLSWSDRVRGEASPDAIMATTLEWLGRHLGATRTTYAEGDAAGRMITVTGEWRDGVASLHGNSFLLENIGAAADREWNAGEIIQYEDIEADPRLEPRAVARYLNADIRAFVTVPLVQGDRLHSALSVHHHQARRWHVGEIQLMRDIAERTWVALERAHAQAALQERERNQAFLLAWNDRIRQQATARDILAQTLAALGEHLGAMRTNFAESEDNGITLCILQEWTTGRPSIVNQRYASAALGTRLAAAHMDGQPVRVDDVATDPRFDERNRPLFDSLGIAAVLTLPMMRGGKIVAVLSVQHGSPRRWTDSEVDLVRDLADRTLAVLERAHSEERLAESEAQLSAFLENAPVAMHLKNEDGRYVRVNPEFAKTLGRTPEDLHGAHSDEIFPPAIAAELARLEELGRDGRVASAEIALEGMGENGGENADGDRHVLSMVFPITGAGVARTGGFTLDLTERKRAEAALARSREALYQTEKLSALGSLLAGVSHELNNPLSIVVAQAVMMERQSRGSELAERAQKIRRAADRCARIVQTFLAMARQKRPEREPVDLNAVANAAYDLAEYGLRNDGIAATRDLAPALPGISADSDQLHQIIINLIVNAQQALVGARVPDRALTVRTATGDDPGTVILEVADNGPGIPEEARRRIFEPFFTTKPQGQGTGVGLSFSQGLAEAHGGRLDLMPAARGACFRLTLPIDAGPVLPPAAAEPVPQVEAPLRKALVVDDEQEIAESLADFLSIEGFVCDIAVGGGAAQEKLAQGQYDLVVSDLRMPGIDGPHLHAWIAAERPDLLDRVAFATGDTLGVAAARFLEEVKRPVLEKPFTLDAVHRFLKQMDLA